MQPEYRDTEGCAAFPACIPNGLQTIKTHIFPNRFLSLALPYFTVGGSGMIIPKSVDWRF